MKKKALTIILSIILLMCIGGNIYQNMTTSELRESLSELTNAKNELTAEIDNKTTVVNNITSEIETANATIGELTAKVDSLASAINATQSKIDGINSTHEANMEEQAAVNRIEENLKKKHPEWFADTPSTGTGEGNYEHVGTPDTGQFQNPNYTVGESGSSDVPAGTVY